MYNDIKNEIDQIANTNYKLTRTNEDMMNERKIFEVKIKNYEDTQRKASEEIKTLSL